MLKTINIVEPTLMTEAGHCFSFINSLCQINKENRFLIWINYYSPLKFNSENVFINKYFFRKFRKFQCVFLYKKLLRTQDKILISTAGRIDLLIFDWISKGTIPHNKVYFYFHWMNESQKKLSYLKKLAVKQPHLIFLGPTQTAVNIFNEAGFNNVYVIPYPISFTNATNLKSNIDFKKVLFAGAPRQDKGFSRVVDLIEYLKILDLNIPFTLQISPKHHGNYDFKTKNDIARLLSHHYDYLTLCKETLPEEKYKDLYHGAICLQPYNTDDFADRISGVTLDALTFGAPIVTVFGTWMARQVERFDAGVVIQSASTNEMLNAIKKVKDDYKFYSRNALSAGRVLQGEHSAKHLLSLFET